MNRRRFLTGMAGILATATAPAIITTPGLLMPVRKIITPGIGFYSAPITIDQLRAGVRVPLTDFGALTDRQKQLWAAALHRAAAGPDRILRVSAEMAEPLSEAFTYQILIGEELLK